MGRHTSLKFLVMFLVQVLFTHFCTSQDSRRNSPVLPDTEAILDCSELNNLSEMSKCLSKKLRDVKTKAASRSYGYPHAVAPTLPPFLRPDYDLNSIISFPERRYDKFRNIPEVFAPERRIHSYSVPRYRNFLDLDTGSQVVVFPQSFNEYDAIPVIVPQNVFGVRQNRPTDDHVKPVKVHRKKAYGYDSSTGYYDSYGNKDPNGKTYTNKNYKMNAGFSSNSQSSKIGSYDKEYYVPANHPIIGDIRRSLMEYTGARDLLEDEPDYLGSSTAKRNRMRNIENDYYPFRRSGHYKDLDRNESKRN